MNLCTGNESILDKPCRGGLSPSVRGNWEKAKPYTPTKEGGRGVREEAISEVQSQAGSAHRLEPSPSRLTQKSEAVNYLAFVCDD